MTAACQLFESDQQTIINTPNKKVLRRYYLVSHDTWILGIGKEAFAKEGGEAYISPLTYLYLQYKQDLLNNTLYAFVGEKYFYLVTFTEEKPKFFKIYPVQNYEDIIKKIESFLKEFYVQEGSYFIEKLFLYTYSWKNEIDPKEIEEKLFIEVEVIPVDLDSLCSVEGIEEFVIVPQEEKEQNHPHYGLFAIFLIVLGGLVGGDYFLRYQATKYKEQIAELVQQQVVIANRTNRYSQKMMQQKKVGPLLATIKEQNEKVIHTIWSVFELIDDETVLNRVLFDNEKVMLEGFSTNSDSVDLLHKRLQQLYASVRLEKKKVVDGYEFVVTASQEGEEL